MRIKPMIYKKSMFVESLYEDTYKGYHFIILSFGSHPCAYIEIPPVHPYYKKDYDKIDINCHGGLTYSEDGLGNCKCGLHREGYWIGWDYAHYGDYYYYDLWGENSDNNNEKKWTTEEIYEEVKDVIEQLIIVQGCECRE
jgi:hypothetical protein